MIHGKLLGYYWYDYVWNDERWKWQLRNHARWKAVRTKLPFSSGVWLPLPWVAVYFCCRIFNFNCSCLLEIGRALSSLVRRNPFGFWLLTVDFFILVQVKLTVTSTSLFGTWSQLLIEAHGFGQVLCCTLHSAFFLNPVTPGCTCAFCFLAVSGFWTCCTGFVHHASWPAPIPIFYCPGPSPSLLLVVLFLIWFCPSTLVSCLEFVIYLFGNYLLEARSRRGLRTSNLVVTCDGNEFGLKMGYTAEGD